jgi:glycosyltransferase involved in cell wall biosynthesis
MNTDLSIFSLFKNSSLNIDQSVIDYRNNKNKHYFSQLRPETVGILFDVNNYLVEAVLLAKDYPSSKFIWVVSDSFSLSKCQDLIEAFKLENISCLSSDRVETIKNILNDLVVSYLRIENITKQEKDLINFIVEQKKDDVFIAATGCHSDESDFIISLKSKGVRYHITVDGEVFVNTNNAKYAIQLSVVVPVFNVEKYLAQCLTSIAEQKGIEIEILVINDSSTDDSVAIADECAKKYSNIKVFTKPNGGCASARNYGLARANGKYVTFVDSDDWIAPHMYADLIKRAELSNADVALSRFVKYYELDRKQYVEPENITCRDGIFEGVVTNKSSLHWLQPAIWRGIYSREFLQGNAIYFPEEIKRFDDLYFAFRVYSQADTVVCSPNSYYHYRLGRVGQDVAIDDERMFVHFEIFNLLKQFIKDQGSSHHEFNLKLVEMASHQWAFSKIKQSLKVQYLKRWANAFSETIFVSKTSVLLHFFRYYGKSRACKVLLLIFFNKINKIFFGNNS